MHRIATVAYLNARPLTTHIDRSRFEVIEDHPSAIARMLREGEVDVALVPVAAALGDGDFRIVPGQAIGADGPVDSVLLVAETEPEAWERVVLDGVSRTSVVLARLLLSRGPLAGRVRPDLVIEDGAPGSGVDAASGSTAAVVIGDVARVLPDRLGVRLDLAGLWKEWTGHPFVFAVWAGRPDLPVEVVAHLREAASRGIAAIPERWEGADRVYLTERLRYALDDSALIGLRRFAALAHADGLLPREEVHLYPPAERRLARPADLDALLARGADGEGLTADDAERMLVHAPLPDLLAAADLRRRALHPEDEAGYLLELLDPGPAALAEARSFGVRSVALSDGPDLPQRVRQARGLDVVVPAVAAARLEGLAEAGARALCGSGDLEVCRLAWALGLEVPAVFALAVGQSPAERVRGLLEIGALHAAGPGFRTLSVEGRDTPVDWLRITALARLLLPIPHLLSSWDGQGEAVAQAALHGGCNDLGAVRLPSDAPETWPIVLHQVERHLRDAGFEPVPRDRRLVPLGEALTVPSRRRILPAQVL